MDVRCPQCDTLYEIDARQFRGGAATLKCSQCDHVFRLQTHAALSRENQRRWMVKNTTSGDVLYFSAFDQLHQWILQGKVGKADQVSRTGKRWKRLENIGEFRPIFQAVESISSISASHAAERREESKALTPDEGSSPSSRPTSPPSAPAASAPSSDASPRLSDANRRRPKVKTSPQFGAQGAPLRPVSPGDAASAEPSGLRESSRPEPSHTPSEPSRSQTPLPMRGGAPADGGARRNPNPASGPQPSVRLQTGAFGAPSNPPGAPEPSDDGEWSFGNGSTLGEVESSGLVEQVDYDTAGTRRWPVVILVAALIVTGAGAGIYFLRPDLLESYLPQSGGEDVVDIARTEKAGDDNTPEVAEQSPDELLHGAVTEALTSAQRANATHLGAAAEAARPKVFAGVDDASQAATKAAEEPDADELLASAQRSLERGDPGRARQKFHQVLEIDRNNPEAITGLGWSLLALGRPGAASAQFQKALSYSPGFGNAYIGLGKAEREQGNHQAALKAYQDYLSRFPGGDKASIARYQADKLKETLGL